MIQLMSLLGKKYLAPSPAFHYSSASSPPSRLPMPHQKWVGMTMTRLTPRSLSPPTLLLPVPLPPLPSSNAPSEVGGDDDDSVTVVIR